MACPLLPVEGVGGVSLGGDDDLGAVVGVLIGARRVAGDALIEDMPDVAARAVPLGLLTD